MTVQPSYDWNLVTLKWAGTYLDGSPATGSIRIAYDGPGPMLDDDATTPLAIFTKPIDLPLTTTTVTIGGQARTVGYATVQVPASNDPDIGGAGGTYSFTENLTGATGRSNVHFVADIGAPGGVIWINKVAGSIPDPGEPLGVVYYADYVALEARVDNIELNGGGGGGSVTSVAGKTGVVTLVAADISNSTATGRSLMTATDAAAGRTAIGAGTSNLALGTTSSTAKAGDYTPPDAATGSKGLVQLAGDLAGTAAAPTVPALAGKANTSHTHGATDLSGVVKTVNSIAPDGAGNVVVSGGGTVSDATTTTKGIVQLAGDLSGTAASPSVPGLSSKANLTHTHAAADVTTGTLNIAREAAGMVCYSATTTRPTSRSDLMCIFIGTTDPGSNAIDGDMWIRP